MSIALSVTNCSKDNVEGPANTPKGQDFELFAAPQTRTVADGMNTKWVADDALNVFHAPAGKTTYSTNDQFTITAEGLATNRFTGTIADADFNPAAAYDWYAIYPYNSFIVTPANSTAGYLTVGSASNRNQTQTGISNQEHICGENIPLYGKAANVTGTPTLQMHHLTTLFKVAVTNTGTEDLNVTNIQFATTSENLIGTYFFDIAGETPVYTPSSETYVSKTASLDVTEGTVTVGASADFYFATKPFTAPADEVLTLTVTANGKAYKKAITLAAAKSFVAGKINTLNYSIAAEAAVPTTWEQVKALEDITEGEYFIVNGAYYLPTGATTSAPPAETLESAGITFSGGSFFGIVPETATWSFTGTNTAMTIRNATGDNLYGTTANNGIRIGSTSATWAFETHGDGFAMKNNNSRYCAVYNTQDWRSYTTKDAANYKQNSGILYLYKKAAAPSTDPFIHALNIDVTAAADPNGIHSYTIGNTTETAVTATCDGTVVTLVMADNGEIIYEVSGNYSTETREGWIELALTSAPTVTKRIIVSQAGSTFTVPDAISIANDATTATFKVVSSDFGWTITAPEGITVNPTTGNAGETEVTVTSNTPNSGTAPLLLGSLSILRTDDVAANAKSITVNKLAAGQSAEKVVDIEFSTLGYTNQQEVSTYTSEDVTISFDKGTNSNTPKYLTSGEAVRVYGGGTITVSTTLGVISKIEISGYKDKADNNLSSNTGTIANTNEAGTKETEISWNGSANNIIFTVNASNGHFRIKTVKVTYE